MIRFLEYAWPLSWMLAILVILRWFHCLASNARESDYVFPSVKLRGKKPLSASIGRDLRKRRRSVGPPPS